MCCLLGEAGCKGSKDKALSFMRTPCRMGLPVQGEKILDNRHLDNAQTMENRMYGKPLPTRMQREVFFIIDKDGENVLTRAYGDVDPEVGVRYEIYGKDDWCWQYYDCERCWHSAEWESR